MKKVLIVTLLSATAAQAADVKSLSDDDLRKAAQICHDLQIQNISNPDATVSYQCRPVLAEQNARQQVKMKEANKPKLDDLNAILKKK